MRNKKILEREANVIQLLLVCKGSRIWLLLVYSWVTANDSTKYSFQVYQLYEDVIIGGRHSKYYNMLSLIFYYTCKFHFF